MSLNIEDIYMFLIRTHNLFKKIKRHAIFLIRHIIFFEVKQLTIVLYNI